MNFFQHLEKHAPDLRKYLNRPVSARALKQLETKTKFKLPPALVKLLQEHNGEQALSACVFFGLQFLSAEEMLSDWTLNIQFHEDQDTNAFSFPPGHIKEDYYNPGWLPIASNFDGNYLGIDFSPGPEGKKGQIINFGRDEHRMFVIAPSFAKFLDLMAQSVDLGNCVWRTEKDRSFFTWKDDSSFLDHVKEVVASNTATAPKAELLSFDSEWRAFLLKLVGTEKPSVADLHAITSLYLMGAGVTDLSPLKYFKNTRELIASTIRSKVFDPIASLRQLKRLYLARTSLADISFLSGMPLLAELSIGNTRVSNLEVLTTLPSLKEVSLENLSVPDLSPLKRCKKLRSLTISGIKTSDLSVVGDLSQLTRLEMLDIQPPNIEFLKGLRNLNRLTLEGCKTHDYSPLAALSKLSDVMAPFDVFQRITPLFDRKLSFGICREMTKAQEAKYHEYIMSRG